MSLPTLLPAIRTLLASALRRPIRSRAGLRPGSDVEETRDESPCMTVYKSAPPGLAEIHARFRAAAVASTGDRPPRGPNSGAARTQEWAQTELGIPDCYELQAERRGPAPLLRVTSRRKRRGAAAPPRHKNERGARECS
ncbi:hypothetical protein EVAR_92735_1 [Eumeta japonica]|uniref:Uncharacterized protein n=1 Tax=Eumeta variegata TaxID=151549 RepID=A0A4C1SZW9_EUMVA|nr:hypothetical protein EVAR_92735_1 [Eumeta japonica]